LKYLTRQWQDGELDDDAFDRAFDEYKARLDSIRGKLPRALLQLTEEIGVGDGIIHVARFHPPARMLELWICTGDLQKGYSLVHVRYSEVFSVEGAPTADAAIERSDEIILDEVDIDTDGTLIHRLLLSPHGELWLQFGDVTFERIALPCRTAPVSGVTLRR
jgi:hypothetical protein